MSSGDVALFVTKAQSPLHPARVHVQSIDGIAIQESKWDGTVAVEVLPGSHIITADYISNRDYDYFLRDSIEIHIDARPGYVYEIDTEDVGTSSRTYVREMSAQYWHEAWH